MGDKNSLYLLYRNIPLCKQIDDRGTGIYKKAVTVVFKVNRRAITSVFGMSVACADKKRFK